MNLGATGLTWRNAKSAALICVLATATFPFRTMGQDVVPKMASSQRSPMMFTTTIVRAPDVSLSGFSGITDRQLLIVDKSIKTMSTPELEGDRLSHEISGNHSLNIQIVSSAESQEKLEIKKISETHFAIDFKGIQTHMFLFKITGAKGTTVRIDLENVFKRWGRLNPVLCDAGLDGQCPTNYEVANVEDGPDTSHLIHNGTVVPSTHAQVWQFIEDTWWVDSKPHGSLCLVHTFDNDSTFIAMKYPYDLAINEKFIHECGKDSHTKFLNFGTSVKGNAFLGLQIGDGNDELVKSKPCVLIYAGEHADETDGMWAARGVIEYLMNDSPDSEALRKKFTFLVIPMLDPDASAANQHEGLIEAFESSRMTSDSVQYANWFKAWIEVGNRLDMVIDLHNVESGESGHIACAMAEQLDSRGRLSDVLNRIVMKNFKELGYVTTSKPWGRGWMPSRLGGWLSSRYGPLTFLYELNSQSHVAHLSFSQLKGSGAILLKAINEFFESNDSDLLAQVDAKRDGRNALIKALTKPFPPQAKKNAILFEAILSQNDNPLNKSERWHP